MTEENLLLELTDIVKSFPAGNGGEGQSVLRGVSLRLRQGETVAVTGPSGSGKSTLLNIAGLLDQADSGGVRLNGRDATKLDDAAAAAIRAQTVGFVFQRHHLLPACSVWENVLAPTLALTGKEAKAAATERAERLLRSVGLEPHRNKFPGELSGGERQRAALARALVNAPQLILADEPTGALDRKTAEETFALLLELNRRENTALLTVTHAAWVAKLARRTLELHDGRLKEV
jgi:lipoprotein-releasing system ATP-binding protein